MMDGRDESESQCHAASPEQITYEAWSCFLTPLSGFEGFDRDFPDLDSAVVLTSPDMSGSRVGLNLDSAVVLTSLDASSLTRYRNTKVIAVDRMTVRERTTSTKLAMRLLP